MSRFLSVLAKGLSVVAIIVAVFLAARAASSAEIVEVRTESGITAWLKQEPSIPIIAMEAVWLGAGAAGDPLDKAGRASMVAAMLDEGAGEFDGQSFKKALEEAAVRLGFEASRDSFSMSLQTLAENRGEAFTLAGIALTFPNFDPEPLERTRAQKLNRISRDSRNPNAIAGRAFSQKIFPADRYGLPVEGT